MKLTPESALVLVSLQRDHLQGGALPVQHAEDVIPPANRLAEGFAAAGLTVVATRSARPAGHKSFRPQGGTWPPYGVQGTPGAEMVSELLLPEGTWVVSTGTHPDLDGYSAFEGTDLAARLQAEGVQTLFVGGMTTDYAVKHTVLDAAEAGFVVVLVADACRGLDVHVGDSARAVNEMLRAGARIASSSAVDNALQAYSPAG